MKSALRQVGLGLAILFMAIGCPSNKQMEEKVQIIWCENNFKQIGLLLEMWAAEHENELPGTLSELHPDYLGEESVDVFVCPSTGHEPGNPDNIEQWSDYVYVKGQRWAQEGASPALLMYENPGNHAAGGHQLYTDGTVTWKPL